MRAAAEWEKTHQRNAATEKAEQEARAKAAPKVFTVKEVETDLPSFIGKTFILEGVIQVSDYYNYDYANAEKIVYSFTFQDETGRGHLYQLRSDGEALRKQVLSAKGPIRGRFLVEILAGLKHPAGEGVMAQLRDWKPPKESKPEN